MKCLDSNCDIIIVIRDFIPVIVSLFTQLENSFDML